jgi:hypothetical protein
MYTAEDWEGGEGYPIRGVDGLIGFVSEKNFPEGWGGAAQRRGCVAS